MMKIYSIINSNPSNKMRLHDTPWGQRIFMIIQTDAPPSLVAGASIAHQLPADAEHMERFSPEELITNYIKHNGHMVAILATGIQDTAKYVQANREKIAGVYDIGFDSWTDMSTQKQDIKEFVRKTIKEGTDRNMQKYYVFDDLSLEFLFMSDAPEKVIEDATADYTKTEDETWESRDRDYSSGGSKEETRLHAEMFARYLRGKGYLVGALETNISDIEKYFFKHYTRGFDGTLTSDVFYDLAIFWRAFYDPTEYRWYRKPSQTTKGPREHPHTLNETGEWSGPRITQSSLKTYVIESFSSGSHFGYGPLYMIIKTDAQRIIIEDTARNYLNRNLFISDEDDAEQGDAIQNAIDLHERPRNKFFVNYLNHLGFRVAVLVEGGEEVVEYLLDNGNENFKHDGVYRYNQNSWVDAPFTDR